MNILFVTNTRFTEAPYLDASARYRCYNFAEDLQSMGHRADVVHMSALKPDLFANYQIVSFSRPTYSRNLRRLVESCNERKILTLADYDDLIFDPDQATQTPQALNQQANISSIRAKMRNTLKGLRLFKTATFATSRLSELAGNLLDKDVRRQVIANGLSNHWLDRNTPNTRDRSTPNKISYLSGSSSHDKDFATIQTVLQNFLAENTQFILGITGKLTVDQTKFPSGQLLQTSSVPYELLPSVIKDSSVSLAPLSNSVFNQCKSHIKFIEAAAFGVPSICSPIPDMSRHSCKGLFLATTAAEWSDALGLVSEPDFKNHYSDTLISYANEHCMNIDNTRQLLSFLTESTNSDQRSEPDDNVRMSAWT